MPRQALPTLALRHFSTTRPALASEPDNKENVPLGIEKLAEYPQALEAINKLIKLLETKGIDVKSGKPPGITQMAKMAMDGDVRAATGEGASASLYFFLNRDSRAHTCCGQLQCLESSRRLAWNLRLTS